jgi:membrane-associated PAP2 superfamily phosphatase
MPTRTALHRASLTAPIPALLLATFLLLLWDASSLDLTMAHWFGTGHGFALQDHWFWKGWLHERVRLVQWLPELLLLAAVVRPFGPMAQLPLARRVQLALGTLLALMLISTLKHFSHTSCPWDLQVFGGTAQHVSHWLWGQGDGGNGHCFPAGHASAGFAYLGGFFVFRSRRPALAWCWLGTALAAGLLLGIAQQIRGAHFMSHTLWTAWLCGVSGLVVDRVTSWAIAWREAKRLQVSAPAASLELQS